MHEVFVGSFNVIHAMYAHNGCERTHQLNIGDWAFSRRSIPPSGGNGESPVLAIRVCGLGSRGRCQAAKRKVEDADAKAKGLEEQLAKKASELEESIEEAKGEAQRQQQAAGGTDPWWQKQGGDAEASRQPGGGGGERGWQNHL